MRFCFIDSEGLAKTYEIRHLQEGVELIVVHSAQLDKQIRHDTFKDAFLSMESTNSEIVGKKHELERLLEKLSFFRNFQEKNDEFLTLCEKLFEELNYLIRKGKPKNDRLMLEELLDKAERKKASCLSFAEKVEEKIISVDFAISINDLFKLVIMKFSFLLEKLEKVSEGNLRLINTGLSDRVKLIQKKLECKAGNIPKVEFDAQLQKGKKQCVHLGYLDRMAQIQVSNLCKEILKFLQSHKSELVALESACEKGSFPTSKFDKVDLDKMQPIKGLK